VIFFQLVSLLLLIILKRTKVFSEGTSLSNNLRVLEDLVHIEVWFPRVILVLIWLRCTRARQLINSDFVTFSVINLFYTRLVPFPRFLRKWNFEIGIKRPREKGIYSIVILCWEGQKMTVKRVPIIRVRHSCEKSIEIVEVCVSSRNQWNTLRACAHACLYRG